MLDFVGRHNESEGADFYTLRIHCTWQLNHLRDIEIHCTVANLFCKYVTVQWILRFNIRFYWQVQWKVKVLKHIHCEFIVPDNKITFRIWKFNVLSQNYVLNMWQYNEFWGPMCDFDDRYNETRRCEIYNFLFLCSWMSHSCRMSFSSLVLSSILDAAFGRVVF